MTKEKVVEIAQQLPDDFQLEDFFEKLLFVARIEEGIRQSDNGETLTEDEAKAYLSRWQVGSNTIPVGKINAHPLHDALHARSR